MTRMESDLEWQHRSRTTGLLFLAPPSSIYRERPHPCKQLQDMPLLPHRFKQLQESRIQ